MPLLDVKNITVRFGGNLAVDDVSLGAEAGQVTALIGPNGAGKTTLFNAITGLLSPNGGRVILDDRDVSKLPSHKRARRGMARTFQRLELFSALSVRENVLVAAEIRGGWARERAEQQSVDETIDRVGLANERNARVDQLPTGKARLVELARALATQPKVLLLDEPASGLDDTESQNFGSILRELAAGGVAVLLVEHDVHLVMGVSDIIHVLDFGRILSVGTPDQIRQDEAVLSAYLGTKS
jgi:branched-chain amino acid transport system ATP-binding protein